MATQDSVTLGEQMRRLRRARGWSLHHLAEETGLSYSHLSRIENDSTVPRADTVARVATALDGDLKLMLELAGSLPRIITDRIASRTSKPEENLQRSAGSGPEGHGADPILEEAMVELGRAKGLTVRESRSIAAAIDQLVDLDEQQRTAILSLIRSLSVDE